MDARIIPALKTLLQGAFPKVRVQDFPKPAQAFKTPALTIIVTTSRLGRFTPKVVEKVSDQKFRQNVGQYETQAKLHYFAKTRKDQYDFIQKFNEFMDKAQTDDLKVSSNLVFSYGSKTYEEANVTLLDSFNLSDEHIVKQGELRTIFDLLIDSPKIISVEVPEIKETIIFKADIGENVQPT